MAEKGIKIDFETDRQLIEEVGEILGKFLLDVEGTLQRLNQTRTRIAGGARRRPGSPGSVAVAPPILNPVLPGLKVYLNVADK